LATSGLRAAEPRQKFLDGLRERGLYDTAIDYLDSMRNNRLA
jgi:pentatricopeptide repeat protein